MPEGPLGAPRLSNIGPLTRPTKDEIKDKWEKCPKDGKERRICAETKKTALAILENQEIFPECDSLMAINSGNCASVAKRVFREVSGVHIWEAGPGDHVWVEYNGKHYDAEVPTGVDDPLDFPFFDRIPPEFVLDNARMAAEAEGRKKPKTIDDIITDVTHERGRQ